MADGIQFEVQGLAELSGRIKSVTDDLKRKGGRFALRKAAQVIRDQARANAKRVDDPATPADIAANIVERWSGRTFKSTGNMKFRVGVMGGAGGGAKSGAYDGLPGKDTRHWRHMEFGTEKTPAQPIFRPVPQQAGQQAVNVFIKEYGKKLDRALKRAKKQAGK